MAYIERLAIEEVRKHDKMYLDFDANEWQTTFSLLNHQARVAITMEKVGKARQRPEELVQVGKAAALLHDMGKLHPDCQNYRRKRILSDEEREWLTDRHSIRSLEFAESMMPGIRSENRNFHGRTFPLIRYHHKPWFVSDPLSREMTYDLMVSDVFNAILENREKVGRGYAEAITHLEQWNPCERYPEHTPYLDEIGESKRAIIWLFGLQANLRDEPNPFIQLDA